MEPVNTSDDFDPQNTNDSTTVCVFRLVESVDPQIQLDYIHQTAGITPDGRNQPCPTCGGTNRLNAKVGNNNKAILFCRKCLNEKGLDVSEVAREFAGAASSVEGAKHFLDFAGVSYAGTGSRPSGPIKSQDPIGDYCKERKLDRESFEQFGPYVDRRLSWTSEKNWADVFVVPTYADSSMKPTGGQRYAPNTKINRVTDQLRKGMSIEGKDAGIYLSRKPEQGDTVLFCEGVKDATVLYKLFEGKCVVAALSGAGSFKPAAHELFAGTHVVYIPDLDIAGWNYACDTGNQLFPITASYKIAKLKGKRSESDGKDCWDFVNEDRAGEIVAAVKEAADYNPEFDRPYPTSGDHSRPTVVVNSNAIHNAVREVSLHLSRHNETTDGIDQVFVDSAGRLCSIVHNAGELQIREHNISTIHEFITRVVNLSKEVEDRKTRQVRLVPAAACKELRLSVLESISNRSLWRPLDRIHHAPRIDKEGQVSGSKGYDTATRSYISCKAEMEPIPSKVTKEEALEAAQRLLDLTHDFPLETESDRTAWLMMILSLVAREAYSSTVPMFLLDAAGMGSGKTLLASIAQRIGSGIHCDAVSMPDNDAELEKKLLPLLREGSPVLFFDNLRNGSKFNYHYLDQLTTSGRYKGRILSQSETATIENRAMIVATGNNITVGADSVRRVVSIRLVKPEGHNANLKNYKHNFGRSERDFNNDQFMSWTRDALMIVKAYIDAGKPEVEGKPLESFESWSEICRNPIVWLGLEDPFKCRDRVLESNDTRDGIVRNMLGLAALIDSVASRKKHFKSSEISAHLDEWSNRRKNGGYGEELSDADQAIFDFREGFTHGKSVMPAPRYITSVLKAMQQNVVEGYSIVAVAKSANQDSWAVVKGKDKSSPKATFSEVLAVIDGEESTPLFNDEAPF